MSAGLGRSLFSRHATRTWTSTRGVYPKTAAIGALHRTALAALSTTVVRSASGAGAAATATAATLNHPATNSTSTPSLREVFDGPSTSISRSLHTSAASPAGLFQDPNLKTPQTFMDSVSAAIARGHLLVERIANAPERGEQEMRKVVKIFDRLSDVICRVIDAAEVVQYLHPDPAWRRGAETVFEEMFSWMNTLNTDPRLYRTLQMVLNTPSIASGFSEAERQTADMFLHDFEKSGIHLSDAKRAQFVQLSDKMVTVGRDFLNVSSAPGPGPSHIMISPPSRLRGLSTSHIQRITKTNKHGEKVAAISTSGWESQMILKHVEDEEVRRAMYVASQAEDKSKVAVLDELLKTRYELAQLVGVPSYGHLFLGNKMAKNPENVKAFLETLHRGLQQNLDKEVDMLRRAKQIHTKNKDAQMLAWDKDFYQRLINSQTSTVPPNDPISAYFSVGNTMDGLSKLFSRLYGISFVPRTVLPGETWHDDVVKLDVMDERDGLIGTLFCDFFTRHGKQSNAVHYYVRCSRRVDDDDEERDIQPGMMLRDGINLSTAHPGVSMPGKPGKYQLPIAVLSCGFSRPVGRKPSLLSWLEVETLFHEMGHAMHSMLGRADYHNVSGTRCPVDFVEIPSIMMEHFLAAPAVLDLFAKHYQTQEPIPHGLVEAHKASRSTFQAIELHSRLTLSMLDQIYHSSTVGEAGFNSTKSLRDLESATGIVPPVPGTAWQTGFGHLHSYGAGYYSYMFGRCVTEQIWDKVFRSAPTSREAGERLKEHVLKWGGSKDPWKCLGGLLEDERLTKGDEEAMKIVGDWGASSGRT